MGNITKRNWKIIELPMVNFFPKERPLDDAFRNLKRLEGADNLPGVPTYDTALRNLQTEQPEKIGDEQTPTTIPSADQVKTSLRRHAQPIPPMQEIDRPDEYKIAMKKWHAKQNPRSVKELVAGWFKKLFGKT